MTRPAHRDLKRDFDTLALGTVLCAMGAGGGVGSWALGQISDSPTGGVLVGLAGFDTAMMLIGLVSLYHRALRGDLDL